MYEFKFPLPTKKPSDWFFTNSRVRDARGGHLKKDCTRGRMRAREGGGEHRE